MSAIPIMIEGAKQADNAWIWPRYSRKKYTLGARDGLAEFKSVKIIIS